MWPLPPLREDPGGESSGTISSCSSRRGRREETRIPSGGRLVVVAELGTVSRRGVMRWEGKWRKVPLWVAGSQTKLIQ